MNYQEAIDFLDRFPPEKGRPSLKRIALFLKENGEPQNAIKTIHVGGTNGKGSTTVILSRLLQSLGLKTGRLIGPHMFNWRERISINGELISEDDFARHASRVKKLSEEFKNRHPKIGALSWYEFICCLAFFYFLEQQVDVSVLEVGLGGRFDGTNAVDNVIASIITNIDLDHTHILGDTHARIAYEKAGIMRANVPVVTAACQEALLELIKQAGLKKANLVEALDKVDLLIEGNWQDNDCPFLKISKRVLEKLALIGPHQKVNACLALLALSESGAFRHLATEDNLKAMESCLKTVRWPGRMQVFEEERMILDVAHNPAGARALREGLDQFSPDGYVFLVGCYRSKDIEGMLKALISEKDSLIACDLNTRRKFFSREEICALAPSFDGETMEMSSVREALEFVLKNQAFLKDRYLVVTGSFATVKETLSFLEEKAGLSDHVKTGVLANPALSQLNF